jgi:hypothetical protein
MTPVLEVAEHDPITVNCGLRMFSRCGGEPIHPLTTAEALPYPDATFSPHQPKPPPLALWERPPFTAARCAAHAQERSARVPFHARPGSPFADRAAFV